MFVRAYVVQTLPSVLRYNMMYDGGPESVDWRMFGGAPLAQHVIRLI